MTNAKTKSKTQSGTGQIVRDDVADAIEEALGIDARKQSERVAAASESFAAFCMIYLPHHFTLKPADMHKDIVRILEDPTVQQFLIIGYRGCGKTTYVSNAYPLWAMATKKYNCFVLINETSDQAEGNLDTISSECEENMLLQNDFPHLASGKSRDKTWRKNRLEFKQSDAHGNVDARVIIGKSRGQRIRGIKYRNYRPEIIVVDDPEDTEWVRTKRNRDKTEDWFNGEVVPAMEEHDPKMIVIGNLLHKDALLARLKDRDLFRTLEFPLIDDDGEITWKGKYPDMEAVEERKKFVDDYVAWSREYLLEIIPEEDQIVKQSNIAYYDPDLLEKKTKDDLLYPPIRSATAVDLAISEKESADFTAIVQGHVVKYAGKRRIWVLPYLVNRRMNFTTTKNVIINSHSRLPLGSKIVIEDVAYQRSAIQAVDEETTASVEGIQAVRDKRARFQSVAPKVKNGIVMFAKSDLLEPLIEQMLDFGVAEHDDMVDALVYLIMELSKKERGGGTAGKVDQL